MDLASFVARWIGSSASERANKDTFLHELCDVLGVSRPDPKTGDRARDRYVFEYDVPTVLDDGKVSVGKVDLFKHGCFLLEAKQGSSAGDAKTGAARRGTPAWDLMMEEARGQALGYARDLDDPPPFLVICDIGYCFELFASFDGGRYRPFPNAQRKRILFADLPNEPRHVATLRALFTDPLSLDPSRHAAKVTRDVAERLARLARSLEDQKHAPELVAKFLMRCLFTMFAEDVGLLPPRTFTDLIKKYWLPHPASFAGPGGITALWQAMNDGTPWPLVGKLLRFNGGLFADTTAIPLTRDDLQLLLEAAERDWADVEPAIFGTLLERALNPRERHMLGAHFTPRAYVERLVRPTIEEPLREEWENVQAEVRKLRLAGKAEDAKKAVHAFHQRLCGLRVLDPACGSGNFLYVALDLFKRIESEVLALLAELGEKQELLHLGGIRVAPGQFLGIEVKRWAKEIAELVLWIGYLQWHYRTHGRALPPPEPVLRDDRNIEWGDAVLASEREEPAYDETGKPMTRWDGETYKINPATGKEVPDEAAVVPANNYINPKKSQWPKADYVVGNPPFVANRNMRSFLGDGYVVALKKAYPEVKDAVDYVMYFWLHAAQLVDAGEVVRAGFVTTRSIRMIQNQGLVRRTLTPSCRLIFAIPDHPWPNDPLDAEVRIAMTVLAGSNARSGCRLVLTPVHDKVARGQDRVTDIAETDLRTIYCETIAPDLSPHQDTSNAVDLLAANGLAHAGMKPYARTLVIDESAVARFFDKPIDRSRYAPPYRNGKDVGQKARGAHVLDLNDLSEDELRDRYPRLYQYVLTHTKPERAAERNPRLRNEWWKFEANRSELRKALVDLRRYVVTVENSPVRAFVFIEAGVIPDQKLRVVASDDAYVLGVLSSHAHDVFAQRVGGRQGVRNTPVYNTRCFTRFPFPACTDAQGQRIRELGEALDAHRKRQQAQHPDLTITGMYNVLEKLRKGEALSDKDKIIHERGLVSILKKLHDDLDAAVFDAYGWPPDLTDEQILEKLVALNAERAEEERRGVVRWLRPELQNPGGARPAEQAALPGAEEGEEKEEAPAAVEAKAWPKKLPEQIEAVRAVVSARARAWKVDEVAAAFKRARRNDVADLLDCLAAVGVVKAVDAPDGRRWVTGAPG